MPEEDQGLDPERYSVIPRTLIFVFWNHQVLLMRKKKTGRTWPGKWNGLGGHVECGEDVLSSAMRELEEESGLKGIELRLAGTIIVDLTEKLGIGLYVFAAEVKELPAVSQVSNEGELAWVETTELQGPQVADDLPTLIPWARLVLAGDPLFHARSRYDDSGILRLIRSRSPR